METRRVMLIRLPEPAFKLIKKKYEHLGLGYLASHLESNGIETIVNDLELCPKSIDEVINNISPEQFPLVGITIPYQVSIHPALNFIQKLKQNKHGLHVVLGGHFPTAAYNLLLNDYPYIDSVIRGEGEGPILELAKRIISGNNNLKGIKGLAYRYEGKIIAEPRDELLINLDELPFPKRRFATIENDGIRYAEIISSRGCSYKCLYCSISSFYEHSSQRYRSVNNVLDEMSELYFNEGCRAYEFLDDNFISSEPEGIDRLKKLHSEIKARGLKDIVLTAMLSPTAVTHDVIGLLYDMGLRRLLVGIESASATSLKRLNKTSTLELNYRALEVLMNYEELGVHAGFIMFEPDTTILDIEKNISFIKKYCSYVSFNLLNRLDIFYGTPIYNLLKSHGRIFGNYLNPQYEFSDEKVSWLYNVSSSLLADRINQVHYKLKDQKLGYKTEINQQTFQFELNIFEKLVEFCKETNKLPNVEESIKLFSPAVNMGFKYILNTINKVNFQH